MSKLPKTSCRPFSNRTMRAQTICVGRERGNIINCLLDAGRFIVAGGRDYDANKVRSEWGARWRRSQRWRNLWGRTG